MKKIAIFLPHIGSGGLTKVLLTLAEALSTNEYSIDLVILNRPIPNKLKNRIPKTVNLVRLNAKRTITAVFPLIKYLKTQKPSVLLSGGPTSNCIAIAASLFNKFNTKVIVTEHSLPSVDVFDSGKIIDKALPFLMRYLYPKADHIVAVSEAVAEDLSNFIKVNKSNIKVIYNPIVGHSLIQKGNAPIQHEWLDGSQYKVVLFVGRLEKVKNIPLLIESFKIANEQINNVKLLIIGDGSEKENLVELSDNLHLQNHVGFLGYIENPYPYMKKADIITLTSLWEGLPTVLIESMAFGTNVIATNNLDGAGEILLNGEIGYFVKSSPEALANAIINGVNTEPNKNQLIDRANNFSIENSIRKYIELF